LAEIQIPNRRAKEDKVLSIFAVRVTIGQERLVANAMEQRVQNENLQLKAVLIPQGLKGYLFVECMEAAEVAQAIRGLRHVRGYSVVGKVELTELEHFLIPTPPTKGLNINDIVEIISGPFKSEKAKITRIDSSKDEVILELYESQYPIPIRVHADFIKLIQASEEAAPLIAETSAKPSKKGRMKKEPEFKKEKEKIDKEFYEEEKLFSLDEDEDIIKEFDETKLSKKAEEATEEKVEEEVEEEVEKEEKIELVEDEEEDEEEDKLFNI